MREAKVLFPTCGPDQSMNRVRVLAYPERSNGMRSCASDRKLAQVKRILSHARDGEGIESVDTDVVVRFDNDEFEGQSFGLALALADKLARFASEKESQFVLCATGVLKNQGQIERVEAFPEKLDLARRTLTPGSMFVFPEDNQWESHDALGNLLEAGIILRSARNLTELGEFWKPPRRSVTQKGQGLSTSHWKPWVAGVLGISAGFVIPSAIVLAYFLITGVPK